MHGECLKLLEKGLLRPSVPLALYWRAAPLWLHLCAMFSALPMWFPTLSRYAHNIGYTSMRIILVGSAEHGSTRISRVARRLSYDGAEFVISRVLLLLVTMKDMILC